MNERLCETYPIPGFESVGVENAMGEKMEQDMETGI